jgi:hypothetical protein
MSTILQLFYTNTEIAAHLGNAPYDITCNFIKTSHPATAGFEVTHFNSLLPKRYPFVRPLKAFWPINLGEA